MFTFFDRSFMKMIQIVIAKFPKLYCGGLVQR